MSNREIRADYVIVGGGQAGFYASTAIRKRDSAARIVLVCDEPHLPYDRVPLSKDYLVGKRLRERMFFRPPEFYDNERIEVISGMRASKLVATGRILRLEDDREIAFTRLLLATGGHPRTLSIPGSDLAGVHYLRTIDDCERIIDEMARAKTAIVIGGGFIGCEVASAFATHGIKTTIIEAASYLLNAAFSEETGNWIGEYFRGKGVNVMTGTQVSAIIGRDGVVEAVKTSRGEILTADMVAIGIGIIPNTELAQEAGIKVDRGIVVSEYLQTEHEDIYAAGDVARFYSPVFNRHLRVEHYDVAAKHGMIAGANMAGERRTFAELPFFFSFMFDLRIKAYGDLSKRTRIVNRGRIGGEGGFFQLYFDDGVLNGFLSVNHSFQEVSELKRIVLSRRNFANLTVFEEESRNLSEL